VSGVSRKDSIQEMGKYHRLLLVNCFHVPAGSYLNRFNKLFALVASQSSPRIHLGIQSGALLCRAFKSGTRKHCD
jgi:hypothetical protein